MRKLPAVRAVFCCASLAVETETRHFRTILKKMGELWLFSNAASPDLLAGPFCEGCFFYVRCEPEYSQTEPRSWETKIPPLTNSSCVDASPV